MYGAAHGCGAGAASPLTAGCAEELNTLTPEVHSLETVLGQMFSFTFRAVDKVWSTGSRSNVPASPLTALVLDPLRPGGEGGDDHDRGPEPATALLFGAALLVVGRVLRRRCRGSEK